MLQVTTNSRRADSWLKSADRAAMASSAAVAPFVSPQSSQTRWSCIIGRLLCYPLRTRYQCVEYLASFFHSFHIRSATLSKIRSSAAFAAKYLRDLLCDVGSAIGSRVVASDANRKAHLVFGLRYDRKDSISEPGFIGINHPTQVF